MTVMGEAWMDVPSDRGSTPRSSTQSYAKKCLKICSFQAFFSMNGRDVFIGINFQECRRTDVDIHYIRGVLIYVKSIKK